MGGTPIARRLNFFRGRTCPHCRSRRTATDDFFWSAFPGLESDSAPRGREEPLWRRRGFRRSRPVNRRALRETRADALGSGPRLRRTRGARPRVADPLALARVRRRVVRRDGARAEPRRAPRRPRLVQRRHPRRGASRDVRACDRGGVPHAKRSAAFRGGRRHGEDVRLRRSGASFSSSRRVPAKTQTTRIETNGGSVHRRVAGGRGGVPVPHLPDGRAELGVRLLFSVWKSARGARHRGVPLGDGRRLRLRRHGSVGARRVLRGAQA